MKAVGLTILAAVTLALAAPGDRAGAAPQTTRESQGEASSTQGHTIGPADVLQITVWKEPDLTREVTVRFDGMITLPLIGDVKAVGQTPPELAEALGKELSRFVELPRVSVAVLQATSARFFVIGQVGRSGEFPLSGRTTLLQALALAGGFREFAKTDDIVIVRRDQTLVRVNYKRIADGSDISQNVELFPGDTIVVP